MNSASQYHAFHKGRRFVFEYQGPEGGWSKLLASVAHFALERGATMAVRVNRGEGAPETWIIPTDLQASDEILATFNVIRIEKEQTND